MYLCGDEDGKWRREMVDNNMEKNLMHRNLYFVDSIYIPLKGDKAVVTLLPTEYEQKRVNPICVEINRDRLKMYNHRGSIREGWYVYYHKDDDFPFGYGNLHPFARKQFRAFNTLRAQLTERFIERTSEAAMVSKGLFSQSAKITSYHLNVGHGNCSIILLQSESFYEIWMVDCSLVDKCNWKNYTASLKKCLEAIACKLSKSKNESLQINRFFLTHTHYDHYNGIEYLVDNNYINERTLCYINLFYQMASKTYIRIVEKLKKSDVEFIEPVWQNSIDAISFFHPECRIYRSKATVCDSHTKYRIVNTPLNNSSIVIMFQLGGHSMVFPGDLERKGFEFMTRSMKCSPSLCGLDYYVVSHHGSSNGHPDIPCLNLGPSHPTKPLDCISMHNRRVVLMGRDGAYNGIYSPTVTSYWDGKGTLVKTEDASHFVELEWESGNVTFT